MTQMPRAHAVRYRQFETLQDMLKSGGGFGQVGGCIGLPGCVMACE